MTDENKDLKKGLPGSFLLFLLVAVLIVVSVHNMLSTKIAKVNFSYQLEHLVNLDLLVPEESRKTSNNSDKLVTFSGKFREAISSEGNQRYHYLEQLNQHHRLAAEREQLQAQLVDLRQRIQGAADWYLHLRDEPIGPSGFVVADSTFDRPQQQNSIVITALSSRSLPSLPEMEQRMAQLRESSSQDQINDAGEDLLQLIQAFRSPILGISDQGYKNQLRESVQQVKEAGRSADVAARIQTYRRVAGQLRSIIDALGKEEGHLRLGLLRSVRDYKKALTDQELLASDLDENEIRLTRSREDVLNVLWYFNNQELSTRALEKQDPEVYQHWFAKAKDEMDNFLANRGGLFKAPDQRLTLVLEKTFRSEEPPPNYFNYLFTFMPLLLVVLLLYFVFSRQMKGVGSNAMNFGKSPAKLLTKERNKVTFKDVAGADEAIEELQEIVEFLKAPQKFTALGGHIPKGVLCVGPPGTGKTLIAKAVAGEADRPFFSISGSDFVEMFVGVGASRIRDMFDQAKKNAPCIIFMDEIDAVGRHRGAGIGGGHDEREQTLNQLLVEMDGFDSNEGVILMAATNRPDVLDRALLRPGRFDRRVVIGLPDIKGRHEILKVHARRIKLDPSVDLLAIARSTPGASGADLMNLLNEAALLAARRGRTAVTQAETVEARDKVLFGKERRSLELDENEKLTTAFHESGHAVVGLKVEHADPVDKVTIIPRGMSLGATHFLPEKNRVSYWRKEVLDQLAVLMGGRAAEEIFLGDICSGAKQDIEMATKLARSMVCEWGMSSKLGTVAYDEANTSGQYLGMSGYSEKRYSESTAQTIDDEVRTIIDEAYSRALSIIKKNRKQVQLMTDMLMEFETLDSEDVKLIVADGWNIEEKRKKLKFQDELHKKRVTTPPPPPPSAVKEVKDPVPQTT